MSAKRPRDVAEEACVDLASSIINEVSHRTPRIMALHMATAVPGLCHTHTPSVNVDETCAYCRRNGNVFCEDAARAVVPTSGQADARGAAERSQAAAARSQAAAARGQTAAPEDVIEPFVRRVEAVLVELAAEVRRRAERYRAGTGTKKRKQPDVDTLLRDLLSA